MIKDVMVRLDGTSGDDVRLAAVNQIAEIFESHITGLFFNVLSSLVPDGHHDARAGQAGKLLDTAKQAGDIIEATVFERLTRLQHPSNLRRFDVTGEGYFRHNIASGAGRGCLCGASAERSIQRTARLDREPAFRNRTPSLPSAGRSEGDGAVRERHCGVE
jgi:hypothetical protein